MRTTLICLAVATVTLAACAPTPEPAAPTTAAPPPATAPPPTATALPPEAATATPVPVTGQAPAEFINAVVADLSATLDIDPAGITVIHDEFVSWNDGALGCPQPGMAYTMAEVDGYRIRLQVNDQVYDYHTGSRPDQFVRCDNPP